MLAFRPDLPMSYEPLRTALSLLIAITVTGLGFAAGVCFRENRLHAVLIGGTVIGFGVYSMHFVGMAAWVVPATLSYDLGYAPPPWSSASCSACWRCAPRCRAAG